MVDTARGVLQTCEYEVEAPSLPQRVLPGMSGLARVRGHTAVGVLCLIALVLGGAAGMLLSDPGRRRPVTVTATERRTITEARTVPGGGGPAGRAAGTTDAAGARARGQPSSSRPAAGTPPAAAGATRLITGRGSTALGTVRLQAPAMIRWTNTSGRFVILFNGGGVGVDSTARSGELFAPAGVYRDVEITSVGSWTLRVG
jgi:hypothetical protein